MVSVSIPLNSGKYIMMYLTYHCFSLLLTCWCAPVGVVVIEIFGGPSHALILSLEFSFHSSLQSHLSGHCKLLSSQVKPGGFTLILWQIIWASWLVTVKSESVINSSIKHSTLRCTFIHLLISTGKGYSCLEAEDKNRSREERELAPLNDKCFSLCVLNKTKVWLKWVWF